MNNIRYIDEKSFLKLKVDLYNFCKKYENNKLKVVDNIGNIYDSRFLFFYNFLSAPQFKNNLYKDILIEYFSKCEKLYPGSSFLLAKKITGLEKNKKIKDISRNYMYLEKYIKNISKEGDEFLELLKFSGPESSIKIETSSLNKIRLNKSSRSKFNFKCNNFTSSLFFNKNNNTKRSVRCVLIEGFLENEKEIFLLLEKSYEEKRVPVIICRGISESISNFIRNFISRNKFPVLIYDNKVDNNDPFNFLDFAKLNNSLPVSIDTGDDIRYDCYEKSFIIDNCKLSRDYIEFKPNEKSSMLLRKEIKEQEKICLDNDSINYLNKRKRRSSTVLVELYLPKFQKRKLQEIKFLIRCYNSIAKFGMVVTDNIIYSKQEFDVVNKLYEKFNDTINNTKIILSKKEKEYASKKAASN